jgi:fido (protein-threonine AMPylation protein)
MDELVRIQELLKEKADIQARLNLMAYDGSPEIKEQGQNKYLYIRKRVAGKLTSTYVDVYSEELYQLLLRNARDARALKKRIRQIEKELVSNGYQDTELSERVLINIDFARANMKSNIYDQAVLEGVGTSFPQTEEIINNGTVNGVKASDVQKILNLKHAWEFILDKDVIQSQSNFYMVSHIAKLVNEGFYRDGGRVRSVPVTIGGSKYVPPIPIETVVKETIESIVTLDKEPIDIAIELCLYCMKTQVFIDGNKRASVIFANQYLIAHGQGFIVIPENEVSEFKQLLVRYYEGEDTGIISQFLKVKCWKNF